MHRLILVLLTLWFPIAYECRGYSYQQSQAGFQQNGLPHPVYGPPPPQHALNVPVFSPVLRTQGPSLNVHLHAPPAAPPIPLLPPGPTYIPATPSQNYGPPQHAQSIAQQYTSGSIGGANFGGPSSSYTPNSNPLLQPPNTYAAGQYNQAADTQNFVGRQAQLAGGGGGVGVAGGSNYGSANTQFGAAGAAQLSGPINGAGGANYGPVGSQFGAAGAAGGAQLGGQISGAAGNQFVTSGATQLSGQISGVGGAGGNGGGGGAVAGAGSGADSGIFNNYISQSQGSELDVYQEKQNPVGDTRAYARLITTCYPDGHCDQMQLGAGQVDPLHQHIVISARARLQPVADKCTVLAQQKAEAVARGEAVLSLPIDDPKYAGGSYNRKGEEKQPGPKRPKNRRLYEYTEVVVPKDPYN